jgi:hypothetical protein
MIKFSKHAKARAQQRAISSSLISRILEHADIEKEIGDSCTLIRVSRQTARSIGLGDLCNHGLIWSDTNAQIVTAMRLKSGSGARRYRTRH